MQDIAEFFNLTPEQAKAAVSTNKNIILTAGAGSGKTRTLVARYINLLFEGGHTPMQLVAITFTKKAAREMRNRVRQFINNLQSTNLSDEERELWLNLEVQMDSARIGTIHSLCSEIIHAHPANVPVDPQFEVLDEGFTATLRTRVIAETLTWAVEQPEMRLVFDCMQVNSLKNMILFALEHRLDLMRHLEPIAEDHIGEKLIATALIDFFNHNETKDSLDFFQSLLDQDTLVDEAGTAMAIQIESLLIEWSNAEEALAVHDLYKSLAIIHDARKKYMYLNKGKRNSDTKTTLKSFRTHWDENIGTWLKNAPDTDVQNSYPAVLPLIIDIFKQTWEIYRTKLDERHALDFDDLEQYALHLLELPHVREYWQKEIHAVLVDEYQDTNQRQRKIINAISGADPGRLFVVGDDRQSIYRFRGADVTVFRDTRETLVREGGEALSLEETFRPHQALIQGTGDLLDPIMAPQTEPVPPYWVSYSPLTAYRTEPRPGSVTPFIELLMGVGKNAAAGRFGAANILAQHLLEMKSRDQIRKWQDVALLFRATTNFPPYEDALDSAGIPYVTIAGRGFYDRPEVRDILNILRAIADPWDDLALAGLLRSPAFGLTDVALYKLRWPEGYHHRSNPTNLNLALKSSLSHLDLHDKENAICAAEFLETFSQLVDRVPVAELLKRIIDDTDYRTMLATENNRFWRNIDKLLADAHNSRIVNVRAFLEYIQNLRDVGVREGEAPPDIVQSAELEGAVQLMSVHKSKGLEFNIVVLADASYQGLNRSEIAYLLPEKGFSLKLDRFDNSPIQYNYLKHLDSTQEEAEDKRLIYVAATRAKEKLIINGHWSNRLGKCWLKAFANAAEIDLKALSMQADEWHLFKLPSGSCISAYASEQSGDIVQLISPDDGTTETLTDQHLGQGTALYLPIDFETTDQPEEDQHPIARAIGTMTHRAIQRWLFPGEVGLDRLLETAAFENQLIDDAERANAIQATKVLLERFKKHFLWTEINSAQEKHHEVSFARKLSQRKVYGKIDLIYLNQKGWHLVDFKVDRLADNAQLQAAKEKHKPQVGSYKHALEDSLGKDVYAHLCFLDYMGQVELSAV